METTHKFKSKEEEKEDHGVDIVWEALIVSLGRLTDGFELATLIQSWPH